MAIEVIPEIPTIRIPLTGEIVEQEASTFPVPPPEHFVDSAGYGVEWLEDRNLTELGEEIMAEYPRFAFLDSYDVTVTFLWRKKGGESAGQDVLARAVRVSGLLAHYCDADVVIWLGADNCRDWQITHEQLRAIVYHELRHIRIDKTGKVALRGHDAEVFADELEVFGAWNARLADVARSARQVALPEARA